MAFKKKTNIYAHGAVKPVQIHEDKSEWQYTPIVMGSTTSGPDAVTAFSLDGAKKLHKWLGEAIKYIETNTK
jgi:hypothetical protein